MTAVGLGQQGSEAMGPGSNLCRVRYLLDFTDICRKFHFNGFHGTGVEQQDFEAVGTGSNPIFYLHFLT